MKLLIATQNAHKLEEISAIFGGTGLALLNMSAFPDMPDVVEDAPTFFGNAAKKAVETALRTRLWTMADNSGLQVAALGGAPGVYSARYAGEHANYEANNTKLLSALEGAADRSACFRTVIALSSPWGSVRFAEGVCPGCIIEARRGEGGFGYDPLFVPDGSELTFAEMAADQKNRISHRARALDAAWKAWEELLTS